MDNFVLYSYFRSSTAYRARIALNLKGVKYSQIAVHLLEDGGQQHKPHYRSINPSGEVPSLIHNGKTISQSLAIMEYLEEILPNPNLLPEDSWSRAKVRQICENINAGIHPLTNLKTTQFLAKEFKLNSEQIDIWQKNWIQKGLESQEKVLQEVAGTFSFGDTLTMADVVIIPQLFSARRFKVDTDQFPIMSRIENLCLQHSAFKDAHPHNQPDTPEELRGRF